MLASVALAEESRVAAEREELPVVSVKSFTTAWHLEWRGEQLIIAFGPGHELSDSLQEMSCGFIPLTSIINLFKKFWSPLSLALRSFLYLRIIWLVFPRLSPSHFSACMMPLLSPCLPHSSLPYDFLCLFTIRFFSSPVSSLCTSSCSSVCISLFFLWFPLFVRQSFLYIFFSPPGTLSYPSHLFIFPYAVTPCTGVSASPALSSSFS